MELIISAGKFRAGLKPGSFILLFFVMLFLAMKATQYGQHKDAYKYVCDIVKENYLRYSPELERWHQGCVSRSQDISIAMSKKELVQQISWDLLQLQTSHLEIYNPVEEKRLWQGVDVDSGIRTRLIDGRFIVIDVLAESQAEYAGVKKGDVLLWINDKTIYSQHQIQRSKGYYEVARGEKTIKFFIEPKSLKIDTAPHIEKVNSQVGQLRISSFRSDYFEADAWKAVSEELANYRHMIIDVRGNSGGNFVAMLRALSPFFCSEKNIGSLSQPRKNQDIVLSMGDEMDDYYHLKLLDQANLIHLKTFNEYGCYKGKVTVLMDYYTASVAEIFAQSFKLRKNSRVWGNGSAGDVVLAVWYEIPLLGKGYSLSIPEASFMTPNQEALEGVGVSPERELAYSLKEATEGKDSWVLRAIE